MDLTGLIAPPFLLKCYMSRLHSNSKNKSGNNLTFHDHFNVISSTYSFSKFMTQCTARSTNLVEVRGKSGPHEKYHFI